MDKNGYYLLVQAHYDDIDFDDSMTLEEILEMLADELGYTLLREND